MKNMSSIIKQHNLNVLSAESNKKRSCDDDDDDDDDDELFLWYG